MEDWEYYEYGDYPNGWMDTSPVWESEEPRTCDVCKKGKCYSRNTVHGAWCCSVECEQIVIDHVEGDERE